jgi:hypothetical protein
VEVQLYAFVASGLDDKWSASVDLLPRGLRNDWMWFLVDPRVGSDAVAKENVQV